MAAKKHGFKRVGNNGVNNEIQCKCGQVWAAKSRELLTACFDAHMIMHGGK